MIDEQPTEPFSFRLPLTRWGNDVNKTAKASRGRSWGLLCHNSTSQCLTVLRTGKLVQSEGKRTCSICWGAAKFREIETNYYYIILRRKILRLYRCVGWKRPWLWLSMDNGVTLSAKSRLLTQEKGYFNSASGFTRKWMHLYFLNWKYLVYLHIHWTW